MEFDETLAGEDMDRISALPDDIISSNILSLLDTRDSVRTSALSTRWKHLYASVPVLDFRYINSPHAYNVINTVANRVSRISKFYIKLSSIHDLSTSDVISWIETATSHFVQKLLVHGLFYSNSKMLTPHSLFTCETLVSLSLDMEFVLSVPDTIRLPKLKKLWLTYIIFWDQSTDESVKRLFSSCPTLESLMVHSHYGLHKTRVFNFSIPSLKVLSLSIFDRIELLINCPNLEQLNCKFYALKEYIGDVLGSLKECKIEAELDLEKFEEGKLVELVRHVCRVESLTLDGDSMQVLLFYHNLLPTFENLTQLELTSYTPDGWQLLPIMLDNSPRLKTLIFPMGFCAIHDFGNPPLPEHVPVCLTLHLKLIKFEKLIGKEAEYKWVEYFLTNALVLKEMEIIICLWPTYKDSDDENDPNVEGEGEGGEGELEVEEGQGHGQGDVQGEFDLNFKRYSEIRKRLSTFQRSSEVCQIIGGPSNY